MNRKQTMLPRILRYTAVAAGVLAAVVLPAAAAGSHAKAAAEEKQLAVPSVCGKLHVEGAQLVGQTGAPVQLKGISTHGIAWYPQFINEDCFQMFRKQWNANLIRLAMYTAEPGGYCTDGDPEALKQLIRDGVAYASAADLYVIVDWHILSDGDPNLHKEEAKAFWRQMSKELSGYDNVIYEICNEPNGSTTWADVKAYAAEILPIIRENDPDRVVLVGNPVWSQCVDQAAADPITEYDNIMYTLHFYAGTHKQELRDRLETVVKGGLPVFVSEYGICDASGNGNLNLEEAKAWMELLDRYQISSAAWNLSNCDESSAIVRPECSKTADFTMEDLSDSGRWLYQMLTGNR